MVAQKYEIEIKSLLGSEEAARALRGGLKALDPACALVDSYTQLNHYFEGGDAHALVARLAPHASAEAAEKMKIMADGTNLSIRTREMNGTVKIVMKASVGSDSSANGVMRMELEEDIPGMTLPQLDREVLAAGYHYQAKWSRAREEYRLSDIAVCLDKNAGYGYLAEFEKVVDDLAHGEEARRRIEEVMRALGVAELAQDRLERMFAHYNRHWPEYYGTDRIFTIE
jgi:adenylate cyclase class IV